MPSFGGWKYSQPQSQGRLSQAFWHWQFATQTWLYFTRRGGSKLLCVSDCLPACLPACNRLPCASEWEAMSRSKSCREICRWEPGLRFYLSHARVCLFVSQALPSWGALLRVLFCNPIEIILILDMTEYSRVPQKEGVRKSSFAVWLRFMPFTRRKKGNIFLVFLSQNLAVLAVCG